MTSCFCLFVTFSCLCTRSSISIFQREPPVCQGGDQPWRTLESENIVRSLAFQESGFKWFWTYRSKRLTSYRLCLSSSNMHPIFQLDFFFNLSKKGKDFKADCDFVHEVSNEIINKRGATLVCPCKCACGKKNKTKTDTQCRVSMGSCGQRTPLPVSPSTFSDLIVAEKIQKSPEVHFWSLIFSQF